MMMKWYTAWAILLLLFNGIGAIYGGWNLIIYPDGSSIDLSTAWLKATPFKSYLVPGIVLFVCNGLFSLFVIFSILIKARNYPMLVMAQGLILCGWLIIQILLIRTVYYLHAVMGFTGLALIYLGWRCHIRSKK
jgi:hypothetical protein